jgi:enoyl-CoA hydratase
MEKYVVSLVKDRICTLTLNRPDVLNALNYELFKQLEQALSNIGAAGDDIACVILRGNGKAFSAGHDLKAIENGDAAEHSDFEASTLELLASLPQPVIAEVHGYCFTGALELALACDLIFIDTRTKLADTHSKWGLSPVWGMTQRLPRRIGISRAKDLMFSSRIVEPDEALRIGLVDKVVAQGTLPEEVLAYAREVTQNSSHSQRICKQILEATDGLRIHDGLDYEYTNSPGMCADMQQRIAKFGS